MATEPTKSPNPPERFHISTSQVLASSLAAVSAAVVCSYFGVAGTVIGTAITSLVATTGSALYAYSLRRTRTRLRQLHRAGASSPPVSEVLKTMREQGRFLLTRYQWATLAIGVGAVFVFALGVITAIQDATSIGTTPLRAHHKHHSVPPPITSPGPPSGSPTSTPSATTTPTGTARPHPSGSASARPTATATATVTVTATAPPPSATTTPPPTDAATATPTGSPIAAAS
jgi:hypothetical protein